MSAGLLPWRWLQVGQGRTGEASQRPAVQRLMCARALPLQLPIPLYKQTPFLKFHSLHDTMCQDERLVGRGCTGEVIRMCPFCPTPVLVDAVLRRNPRTQIGG